MVSNIYKNLNNFFEEILIDLPCQTDTRAYIISIFAKYKGVMYDLSKDSITLEYARAREKQDFNKFQNLADWIFFTKTLMPKYLNNASEDYYRTIGRLSYYSCYKLINREWKLFEEIADNFIPLENKTRRILQKTKISI